MCCGQGVGLGATCGPRGIPPGPTAPSPGAAWTVLSPAPENRGCSQTQPPLQQGLERGAPGAVVPSWESGLYGPGNSSPCQAAALPTTLRVPIKTEAFSDPGHRPGPARPPPRTSCFPDPGGQPPALFALSQPGLCLPDRGHRGAGRRKGGVWVGGGGERLEIAELEGR